jgi:hypothetical protein
LEIINKSRFKHNPMTLPTNQTAGTEIIDKFLLLKDIKQAIEKATGYKFFQYAAVEKFQTFSLLRWIFIHHCYEGGMHPTEIGLEIEKGRVTVLHGIKRYNDEIMTNGVFRVMAYHTNYYLREIRDGRDMANKALLNVCNETLVKKCIDTPISILVR